VEKVYP
jgi:hypothetical protein